MSKIIYKNDKEHLVKLIQENPDLPVVFLVRNDEIATDYGSTVMEDFYVDITEIYKYDYYGDIIWSDDRYDVKDHFRDVLADDERFVDLQDPQYDEAVEKYIEEEVEHYKAIVISVRSSYGQRFKRNKRKIK